MQTTYSVTKDDNHGINQTTRKTLVHFSGRASRKNSVQVLATTKNSGSEGNKFLSNQKKKLSQQSQADLKWWKENLLLRNNKPLKIGMPQLVIQVDASKTGLR